MSKLFVVDTENTNNYSFINENSISSEDQIVLFISENMKGIKFDGCIALFNTKAKIITEEVIVGEKNLLDFQLVVFVTERALRGNFDEIFIVSDDHGYRHVTNYIENKYGIKIKIIKTDKCVERKKELEEIKPKDTLVVSDIKKIVKDIIPDATNKKLDKNDELINKNISLSQLHNTIVQMFGDSGKQLYKKIKPLVMSK